jgi:hypothetical protein
VLHCAIKSFASAHLPSRDRSTAMTSSDSINSEERPGSRTAGLLSFGLGGMAAGGSGSHSFVATSGHFFTDALLCRGSPQQQHCDNSSALAQQREWHMQLFDHETLR